MGFFINVFVVIMWIVLICFFWGSLAIVFYISCNVVVLFLFFEYLII